MSCLWYPVQADHLQPVHLYSRLTGLMTQLPRYMACYLCAARIKRNAILFALIYINDIAVIPHAVSNAIRVPPSRLIVSHV